MFAVGMPGPWEMALVLVIVLGFPARFPELKVVQQGLEFG